MILSFGTKHPEVGNWQRFLNEKGYTSILGDPLKVDEDFGRNTKFATINYQANEYIIDETKGGDKLGTVGLATRSKAISQGFVQFILAKNFTTVSKREVEVIVIHTMEFPQTPDTAERIAQWAANPLTAPRASWHYAIDENSIVQCVRDKDIAWHAPGCNHNGIGIEHAGYSKYSATDWEDDNVTKMLILSSQLVAKLCKTYNIPVTKLDALELRSKHKGICGHVDVTNAFTNGKGHWDPGPNFPWGKYLDMVEDFYNG